MKCAIMQPTFLPWLGYFDLIRSVDKFIIYDHVQFEKQSWQQKNRIRNKQGELMLTVPVLHDKGLERRINEVKIDYSRNILTKHLNSIRFSYSKSNNFDEIFPEIEQIINKRPELLMNLNIALIKLGMQHLGINKELIFSSSLNVSGNKVEALVDVCNKVGANEYLSPVGSKGYIDENNIFADNGISLSYQNYTPPAYNQFTYPDFISHLSFIDFLFNVDKQSMTQF